MVEITELSKDSLDEGIKVFKKAMKFPDEMLSWLINSANLFYDKRRLIALGVFLNNKIIGFGSIIPYEDTAWIPYVGIEETQQGKGYGRELMQELLKVTDDIGYKSVSLCASNAGLPLYKKLGFKEDYIGRIYSAPENNFEAVPSTRTRIYHKIPKWVLKMDKEILGEDRSRIFRIHLHNQLQIIAIKNKAYGFLYGETLGPIIANKISLAKHILETGIFYGAKRFNLVLDSNNGNNKREIIEELKLSPNLDFFVTKMTYGMRLQQQKDAVIGLRSFAYG